MLTAKPLYLKRFIVVLVMSICFYPADEARFPMKYPLPDRFFHLIVCLMLQLVLKIVDLPFEPNLFNMSGIEPFMFVSEPLRVSLPP